MGHIIDFLGFKFNTLKIEVQLPKDKQNKAIEKIENILEKKNSIIHKKLQSLVVLLSLATKNILPNQTFFNTFTML